MKTKAQGLEGAAELLKLLGNPSRLSIVRRLASSECTVATLETELGIRQPSLSQQLGELRKARIITDRRVAKNVHYALSGDRHDTITAILMALDGSPESEAPRAAPVSRDINIEHAARFGRITD